MNKAFAQQSSDKFIIGAKYCNSPEIHKLDCVRIARINCSLNQNYRFKSLRSGSKNSFSANSESLEYV